MLMHGLILCAEHDPGSQVRGLVEISVPRVMTQRGNCRLNYLLSLVPVPREQG